MHYWERFAVLGGVVLASFVLARLIDLRMRRSHLKAGLLTRYRVLRRTVISLVVFIALLSGLLVIPQVRAVAGALLASGAVIGLIFGFAAQKTLANFASGLLIAFTQPLRIGDRIVVNDVEGVVEEIRLTFTFIRADDDTRFVIPNERLASDTIRNSTIVTRAQRAEVTVQVPLSSDLETVIDLLRAECIDEREPEVFVSDLADKATVTMRTRADDPTDADRIQRELRLRAHRRLRVAGVLQ
ncbi:MAG TPA: mechanosensitive ion channel domain-containing protein [Gaiellaceae bacterium]|nr:mechanosensitive ion channel domain-containing protein [Gaiellaceae bacterium]